MRSRRSSPSPAPAWCIAPRSCSSKAPGPRRSRRPAGPASDFGRASTRSPRRRPSTSGRRCTGCAARSPPPRRTIGAPAVRVRAAAGPRPAAAGAGRGRRGGATIRRALGATTDPLRRARCCRRRSRSRSPRATSRARTGLQRIRAGRRGHRTRGARGDRRTSPRRGPLAQGEAEAALFALRRALEVWQAVGAPYEIARVRVLIGSPAGRSPMTTGPSWNSPRRERLRATSVPRRTSPGSMRSATRGRRPATGLTAARTAGAAAGFRWQDQRGHRRRALAQPADGRAAPQQHLHQARSVVADRRRRLDVPARTRLSADICMGEITHNVANAGWVFPPKRGHVPPG